MDNLNSLIFDIQNLKHYWIIHTEIYFYVPLSCMPDTILNTEDRNCERKKPQKFLSLRNLYSNYFIFQIIFAFHFTIVYKVNFNLF